MNTQFSSIWLIERILSRATILGQSEPGSDGDEGTFRIPQIASILEPHP